METPLFPHSFLLTNLSNNAQLPRDFFRNTHEDAGSNGLAMLNYPALDQPPKSDDIRAGSHKGKYIRELSLDILVLTA